MKVLEGLIPHRYELEALRNEVELLRHDNERLRRDRDELSGLLLRLLKERYKKFQK